MISGPMATIILVLSVLGIVGFGGLLIVGFRMWGEERAAKAAAKAKALEPTAPFGAEMALEIEAAAPAAETPEAPEVLEPDAEPLASAPVSPQSDTATPSPTPELAAPPALEAEAKTPGLRLSFLDRVNRGPAVQEILRVVRDPATGQVIIHIAGKPYTNFRDIQNAANEQAFMMAYRLLQAFSENAVAAPRPAEDAKAALPQAEPAQPSPVAYRAAELPPPELPSMQPLRQFRKMRGKQPPATTYVIKSITEQIEDHLQDKIARTPLARRGVHVRSELQGTAVFLLDGKAYPSVDEVPDPEVRQVIREAISEWEKKK